MREIKFKFFCSRLNKIHGPYLFHDLFGFDNKVFECTSYYEEDFGIPLQYTGFKDKNEKEIYEGDILSLFIDETEENRFIIEFKHGSFILKDISCDEFPIWNYRYSIHNFQVIGNIYENPELMTNSIKS